MPDYTPLKKDEEKCYMHHLLSCFVLAKPNQFFKKKFKTINATLRSIDSFRFLLKRISWNLVKQSSSANDACNW